MRAKVRLEKVDPPALKRAEKAAAAHPPSKPAFGQIADGHVASHEASWRNPKHRAQWAMTLTEYCAPIRNTPVDEIDTQAVLKVLKPLWTRARETASRLRGRVEAVLNAARALGHIDDDKANPARWKGHLDQLLPNPKRIGVRGNYAAMPYADVRAFMVKLKDAPGTAAKALAFAIVTAARSGEVLGAKWDEIDLEAGVWTVPKERMKAKREHRVPLSTLALAILREQLEARNKDDPYVFAGARPRQPLSVMALAMAMRRLGAGQFTVHGFRSAFRDWAGDETLFPREVAEAALAHAVGDETERAYRRGDALTKRRELMTAWSDWLQGPETAKVVSIAARQKRQ